MRLLKRISLVGLVVLAGLVSGWFQLVGQAAKATNNVGFSVAAQLPKNQIDAKNSFYDLKLTPGQNETLKATVYNETNRDIKVRVGIHTAWTNANGAIDYTNVPKSFDPSLQNPMSQISQLQGPKTITVPANSQKVVTTQVKLPKDTTDGVILGGWFFKRVDQKVTSTVKNANNIHSAYAYVIGMKFTIGKVPAPKLVLGKLDAGTYNYHGGIIVNLRNPKAVIVPNLKMNTKVTSLSSGKVVKQLKKDNVQMAPNTVYRYPMLVGETKLKAGRYHIHMVVKNSAHRWVFDRNFTITKAAAKQANAAVADQQGYNLWLLFGLGALAMLVLVLLVWLLIYWLKRRRQNNDSH
ncbi:DUF916 and DUF3324 domain-containing protein [Lactiplantibacillus sp. WILCCON 0030]|uniref:DUF916 and DUF3324 domain-containing protein n=1 Tax=Lactiplantibacillus brownii TaxID=3069269 RepID=A0ABU1AC22_9LACO|nr:DUF916 and DUF3324 domain-containing protein [Lactiplantibacillus brownii]MDQ7937972.1 DUF916 and DUF3324 domain-containing protein [Lactiplantibacillus brownii]